MKNLMYIGFLFLMLGITLLYIKVSCDFEDYKVQVATEKWETEKRFEQVEKDIRILKMDSYINTNGFEGGSND